jgi:NAD(P)H-flavin reductase
MTGLFHPYDVNLEAEVKEPLNFRRRDRLQHVDRTFKSEITNITKLTEMEKLFHIRIVRQSERDRFTFLPGQFAMVEVPGYGEIPISISGSTTQRGMLELCIRRAGLVTVFAALSALTFLSNE